MVFNLKRAMGAFKVPFDYDKRYVILVPQWKTFKDTPAKQGIGTSYRFFSRIATSTPVPLYESLCVGVNCIW